MRHGIGKLLALVMIGTGSLVTSWVGTGPLRSPVRAVPAALAQGPVIGPLGDCGIIMLCSS